MDDRKSEKNTDSGKSIKSKTSLLAILMEQAESVSHLRGAAFNMALFLAHKEEIEEAIKAGWNSKVIWRALRESKQFNGSYESFRKYVKIHILQKRVEQSCIGATSLPAPNSQEKSPPQATTRFEFSATPHETDLI